MGHFSGYFLEERKRLKPNLETLKGHFDKRAMKCLRLAKEHWDDEHWGKESGEARMSERAPVN
ncbi:hypothetical protein CLAFUW4_06753 [Fulvia fulva]|uniref:Uncharacterized protein n=1 Tax=Passalora fulva TaxID=5499 RepID=A0A9Q8P9T0_PASFU|nr:uncharacterized protein CLAFUR5_06890 [Fulvia fulva]KAK4621859.1 hypothetical protein CLAFUR4_06761 [Fulvia fulva]KAK4622485.1 hypothetical protein CLAFUR0_06756 [Fulvia fulva]UJO18508.1 hypothetical protein CLAFUR5_06890 [Fulvia fulva]WPV16796.1 hypothetical protein CLAFUW4_06753 [Fulvia fulva]WPV31770.1 hypothetical protein CLAFUW7_06752 [Fulvia fulva]